LNVKNFTSQNIINTTTNNYQLIVSEDLSLNGRMYVTGNVGIGVTNPVYALDVSSASSAPFRVGVGATNAIVVNNTGYVGIGVTNPVYTLDVSSASTQPFRVGVGATNALVVNNNGLVGIGTNAPAYTLDVSSASSAPFRVGVGATNALVVNNAGYVGIGTTAPAYTLDVSSGTGTKIHSMYIHAQSNNGTMALGCFNQQNLGTFGTGFALFQGINGDTVLNAASNQSIGFKINNNLKMVLDSNGRLGIGTGSPNYPLSITTYTVGTNYANTTWFQGTSTAITYNTTTNITVGLYCQMGILTSDYIAATKGSVTASDKRIKENIIDVNKYDTIEMLRKLKPRHFTYIDRANFGNQTQIGYIADEVFEINKDCIKYTTQYIPNIYELANVSNNIITLNNKTTTNLEKDASGNLFPKLKLYDASNNEIMVDIVSTLDDKRIEIKDTLEMNKVFVYGQEINNYKFLSYEYLNVVTTAAVQTIDTIVQKQQSTIEILQTENQTLKDQITSILARLTALEDK
jgi:hypothetical protein